MRILFVLSTAIVFFLIGTYTGSRFFVPAGSGMAGGVIALSYGLLFFVVAAVLAFIVFPRLPDRWKIVALVPAGILALLIVMRIAVSLLESRASQIASIESAIRKFPPFSLTLQYPDRNASEDGVYSFAAESNTHSYETLYHDGSRCGGNFSDVGQQKSDLLRGLRNIEIAVSQRPDLCETNTENSGKQLSFSIVEYKPPQTSHQLTITEQCLLLSDPVASGVAAIENVRKQLARDELCEK